MYLGAVLAALVEALSLGGLRLAQDRFVDARTRFGDTPEHPRGERGHSPAWSCWLGPDGTVLVATSEPEMGLDGRLDGLALLGKGEPSLPYYPFDEPTSLTCAPSRGVSRKLHAGPVRLGDSIAGLERRLGPPTERAADRITWEKPGKEMRTGVTVGVRDGHVVSVVLYGSTFED